MSGKTSKKNKKKKYSSRVEKNKNIYYKNNSSLSPVRKNNGNKKYLVVLAISIILNSVLLLMVNNRNNSIDELKNSIDEAQQTYEKELENVKEGYTNYLFLGDSITEYYDLDNYYPNMPVINSGIAGNTTSDILNEMNERVYQYNPSKIFILIGTNDLQKGKKIEDIVDNIDKIIKEIKLNREYAEIYLQSIYPVDESRAAAESRKNDDINEVNGKLEKIAEDNKITYVDIHSILADENSIIKSEYTKDGLHLSAEGYKVVTEYLAKYL